MQAQSYTARERITTGDSPMDLDAGRLSWDELLRLSLFTLGAWGLACVGLFLAGLVWGGDAYEHRAIWLTRAIIVALGAGLAALSVFWGGAAGSIVVGEWIEHQARLRQWHQAALRAYETAGGQQVDRQLSMRSLSVSEPAHVLWCALSLAERIRREEIKAPSVANLTGPVWVGLVQFGELSKPGAEEMMRALTQIGLVGGRKVGAAGQLVTLDAGEIVQLVTMKAGKIKTPAPALLDTPKDK